MTPTTLVRQRLPLHLRKTDLTTASFRALHTTRQLLNEGSSRGGPNKEQSQKSGVLDQGSSASAFKTKGSYENNDPMKQPDPQKKPESSTGYGAQEEVTPEAEGSQKNIPGDKD